MLAGAILAAAVPVCASESRQAEFFESRIRPLLAAKCFACHTQTEMGGLRLDSREAILKGGGRGAAAVPGDPESSLLIQAVTRTHAELKMPPTEELAAGSVADLRAWIRDGAYWPEKKAAEAPQTEGEYVITPEARQFWSFQPVNKPKPPDVRDSAWPRNDIDRFILARIEAAGLKPAPAADKRTLIRRATFDLTGLPPTPKEVEAFLADDSPGAFARLIDRLLASPHYGERWGRYWLDLARYSDGRSSAKADEPLTNAWRYRDWVVEALNNDIPYDRFIRAQLAADLFPEQERAELLPALGFHALRDRDDDRVDVTSRVFLGLTVGCAQCHDHKYDPIPTQDYYSLQGVFTSSEPWEYPLAPKQQVEAYKTAQKKISEKKIELEDFLKQQTGQLTDILMAQTAEYVTAAWRVLTGRAPDTASAASEASLDAETLERWVNYLRPQPREHPYLKGWDALIERDGASAEEARQAAAEFQRTLLAIHKEKRAIDDRNYVKLGGAEGARDQKTLLNTNLEFLDPVKWYLWRDVASEPFRKDGFPFDGGIVYYGQDEIKRFLGGFWREHLERLERQLEALKKNAPEPYPFLYGYREAKELKDVRVAIRGDTKNRGEVAPRRFLRVLCDGEPPLFTQGSGRWDLAEAIASPTNPLTARVMANRVWLHHFGEGIVGSPSNFGQLGERPTHPALLDYLASRLVESGWSLKALHREIMLSATYQLSATFVDENYEKDADNTLYWRANLRQRLDAEALRDAMLAVAGVLDPTVGGPPLEYGDENRRRTLYAVVDRTQTDRTMTLFDFPDPKATSEQRSVTLGPLQRLYFLNGEFVVKQARAFAERLRKDAGDDLRARVQRAYELAFSRPPSEEEIRLAEQFIGGDEAAWPRYAQMLLASAEFSSVP